MLTMAPCKCCIVMCLCSVLLVMICGRRFKELVTSHRPVDILSDYEYSQLYHEVDAAISAQEAEAKKQQEQQKPPEQEQPSACASAPGSAPASPAAPVGSGTVTPSTTTASDETTADASADNGHEVASATGEATPAESCDSSEVSAASQTASNGDVAPPGTEDVVELKMLAEQEALAKVN